MGGLGCGFCSPGADTPAAVGARRAGPNSLFSPWRAASREELSSVPLVTSKFSLAIVLCLLVLLAFGESGQQGVGPLPALQGPGSAAQFWSSRAASQEMPALVVRGDGWDQDAKEMRPVLPAGFQMVLQCSVPINSPFLFCLHLFEVCLLRIPN